jgi:excisionase family DNA binding protein
MEAPETVVHPEPTMRTAEVARALGVSPRAIRIWADAGKIQCYRTFGGHRLFPMSEVRRVIDELRGTRPATTGS